MNIYGIFFPSGKQGGTEQCHCSMQTLEDPSSNICENEGAGPTPSGHTHYLNIVFKLYLITFRQGVWHEGVGPTP